MSGPFGPSMFIVHGVCSCFRCLIFKVQPRSTDPLFVGLSRERFDILSCQFTNVKHYFCFFQTFFRVFFRAFPMQKTQAEPGFFALLYAVYTRWSGHKIKDAGTGSLKVTPEKDWTARERGALPEAPHPAFRAAFYP